MWYQLTLRVKLRHSFKLVCNILQHKGTSYWIFAISCNKVMHFWTNINNPLLFTYVFESKCGNEFAYSTVNCQSILTIQGHYSEKSNKSLDHIKQKWTKMDLKGLKRTVKDRNGLKWTEMDWNGLNGLNGLKWTEMDQNGLKWTEMDQNGPKWIKKDQNG